MNKKSLATIQVVDLFGESIAKAHYEVKNQQTGQLIATGATNAKGCIVEISRDKGTVLDVFIKSMFNGAMVKVQSFSMSKDRMLVKITSPKVLLDLNTLANKGSNGQYKRKTHIVKKGETLSVIAQQNNTTVRALERLNNIDDPNKISIGQVIKLPVHIAATGNHNHQDKPKPTEQKKSQTTTSSPKPSQSRTTASKTAQTSSTPSKTTPQAKSTSTSTQKLDQAYDQRKKELTANSATSKKIPTTNDRSQDVGTPKASATNLCTTNPQCISSGKSELIREVNIRLAGFGGALPTDEFTELTAKCIKQFQRDYMGAPETGKICGSVLTALDDFKKKYPIDHLFEQMRCPCKQHGGGEECKGFGNNRTKTYSNGTNAIEYPGMHRSVIWILKATIFYLSRYNKKQFSLKSVDSVYRCIENNNKHNGENAYRTTVNHMGLALDLHFNKNGNRTRSVSDMNLIRDTIFSKFMQASTTRTIDHIYLEPDHYGSGPGATTWVHFDVTKFNKKAYLKNDLFVKSATAAENGNLIDLLKKLNLQKILGCSGVIKTLPSKNLVTNGTSIGGIIGKVIASHESNGDYRVFNRGTVGKYASTGGKEDIAKRTINEWIYLGSLGGDNINKRFAMGKYQVIPDTLIYVKDKIKLTGDEKITNNLQETIFLEAFIKPTIIHTAIVKGDQKNIVDACMFIAKTWASVGVPYDTIRKEKNKKTKIEKKIPIKKGQSFYAGMGGIKPILHLKQ
ncbi:LysM peptidoglycan-binding domain-containing protein [Acinetobacter sp. ANC 4636]